MAESVSNIKEPFLAREPWNEFPAVQYTQYFILLEGSKKHFVKFESIWSSDGNQKAVLISLQNQA